MTSRKPLNRDVTMSILPASQNKRRALVRISMIALGVVLLALALVSRTLSVAVHWPVLAVLAVFCVLAVLEFVTFDEAAKYAHFTAWYWGSLLGLFMIAFIQVAAGFSVASLSFVQDAIARRRSSKFNPRSWMIFSGKRLTRYA